jgi:hypothetical protein
MAFLRQCLVELRKRHAEDGLIDQPDCCALQPAVRADARATDAAAARLAGPPSWTQASAGSRSNVLATMRKS